MKEAFDKIRKILRSPAMHQIWRWTKCVHGRVFWICFIEVAIVLFTLGETLVTKDLIDAATSFDVDNLIRYAAFLIALVLIELLLGAVISVLHTKASAKLQAHMQELFINDWLHKEYASLKDYHSGELVNRVFSDVGVIKNGVLGMLPGIASTVVGFVGSAAILIALDWRFVVLLMIAGVIGIVLVLLFRNPMKKRHKRMQEAEDKLHAIVQETFENLRLIKASASERRVLKKVGARQKTLEKEQIRQGLFSVAMNNGMGLTFDFTWLFCMIWGSMAIFRGEMTYGSLAAMIQLIGRVQGPIADAVGIAGELYRMMSSAERLMELSDLPSEEIKEYVTDFDEIRFEHVYFRYEDAEEEVEDVLKDINCTIHKGDFVALTGASGGGKSTMFQLLLGIYEPRSGEVLIQDKENATVTKAGRETRRLFAYVPQGNSLFSGTLRDNLTLFADDPSEEQIWEALRIACIDDFVEEIGLDAELGERGVGISEGQAQRVAVARALIAGSPILLLDEATSALDEKTEARMLKNLSESKNKTCFIVTHRPAALSVCDYEFRISDNCLNKIFET